MPKTLSSAIKLLKNSLDDPGSWVILYEIDIGGGAFYYLANHPDGITVGGATYNPFPIRQETILQEQSGKMAQLVIHVQNVDRQVQAVLETQDGLRGKAVTMKLFSLKALEVAQSLTFRIESAIADAQEAIFVLGRGVPGHGVNFPTQIISRDLFPSLPIA